MKIWMRGMFCIVIIGQLHSVTEKWTHKKDCLHVSKVLGARPTDVRIEVPIDTTDALFTPDKTTRRTCVVAGLIALGVCYKLIPWMESEIRSYGERDGLGGY